MEELVYMYRYWVENIIFSHTIFINNSFSDSSQLGGQLFPLLLCHIISSVSVHIRYDILKYKNDADIKEAIRLGIYTIFAFTPYYDPPPPSSEVVASSMSSFWKFINYQKRCVSVAVCIMLLA